MRFVSLFAGVGGFDLGFEQADSHRYKQMGNAVSVPVVHYVASLINMALEGDDVRSS